METIQLDDLSNVRGGAGILGGILQAAGPVLNGVANIIGAAKSGKGGGQPQAPQGGAAQSMTAAATMSGESRPSLGDSGVSVEVRNA